MMDQTMVRYSVEPCNGFLSPGEAPERYRCTLLLMGGRQPTLADSVLL